MPPSESRDVFARAMEPTALIHRDVGGGNELVNAGGVSLIDFEVSGLANAMIEAAILRMLLRQGEAEYALPDDVVAALEADYARQAPMTAEAYALGCAYVFCMEFGWTYTEPRLRDSDIAKTAHRRPNAARAPRSTRRRTRGHSSRSRSGRRTSTASLARLSLITRDSEATFPPMAQRAPERRRWLWSERDRIVLRRRCAGR